MMSNLFQPFVKPSKALLTGAQAMEARRIYAAMKDGLCRPDALTLTSLATAYQRAGKWDWAEQVLPLRVQPALEILVGLFGRPAYVRVSTYTSSGRQLCTLGPGYSTCIFIS